MAKKKRRQPDQVRPAPASIDAQSAAAAAQAQELLAQGRRDEALTLLRPLAAATTAPAAVLRPLAAALMQAQNFDEAATVFQRLLDAGPETAGLRNSLAMALIMAERQEDGFPHLLRAAELEPANHVFQTNLGKYFLLNNDHYRAAEAFERALELAPPAARDGVLGLLNRSLALLGRPLRTLPPLADPALAPAPAPPAAPAAPAAPVRPAAPARPAPAATKRLLLCCPPGLDNFVDELIAGLAPGVRIDKLVTTDLGELSRRIREYDHIWIEWGNEFATAITRDLASLLAGKRVYLRIHHYEVVIGLADQINYQVVTDLIFVCLDMRDLLLGRRPDIRQTVPRIHVIPNGVNLARHRLVKKPAGHNIAYIGFLNFKKGPILLMHAFERLWRRDPRLRLHLAGAFQDQFHERACQDFLKSNGMEHAAVFHGWIKDISAWLADKNYILCTSLSESQGMGLMEAMAGGLRPLIYNFPGATGIYPPQLVWKNLTELEEMLHTPYDPGLGRRFVADNYSLELQLERTRQMLAGGGEVVFAGYAYQDPGLPQTPAACFSPARPERQRANKAFGLALKGQGHLKPAMVYLERAWSQSRGLDGETLQALVECHQARLDFDGMAQPIREAGFAAAARGDYETMLNAFYEVYYAAYLHTQSYRHQHFDPAIDTVLRLVADKVQPLPAHQDTLARLDPGKIKLALAVEAFQTTWAAVKRFVDIGLRLDKRRFEVIYISRMPPDPAWEPVMAQLRAAGCHILLEPGRAYYPKLQRLLFALKAMRCDALMLNTPFVTPWYDLLGHCRAADKVVKFVAQGGGLETNTDLAVSVIKGALADEPADGLFLGPAYVSEAPRLLTPQPRQPGRLRAVCVGRQVKFLGQRQFWRTILTALDQVPGLSLDIIGTTAEEVFGGPSPAANLDLLGFRDNAHELVADYDLMIDTWPSGGGCTVREAHAAGVPVISCRTSWNEHYREGASFYGGLDDFIHPELLLPEFETGRLIGLLSRLSTDLDYYRRIVAECRAIPVLSPEQFVDRLAEALEELTRGRGA